MAANGGCGGMANTGQAPPQWMGAPSAQQGQMVYYVPIPAAPQNVGGQQYGQGGESMSASSYRPDQAPNYAVGQQQYGYDANQECTMLPGQQMMVMMPNGGMMAMPQQQGAMIPQQQQQQPWTNNTTNNAPAIPPQQQQQPSPPPMDQQVPQDTGQPQGGWNARMQPQQNTQQVPDSPVNVTPLEPRKKHGFAITDPKTGKALEVTKTASGGSGVDSTLVPPWSVSSQFTGQQFAAAQGNTQPPLQPLQQQQPQQPLAQPQQPQQPQQPSQQPQLLAQQPQLSPQLQQHMLQQQSQTQPPIGIAGGNEAAASKIAEKVKKGLGLKNKKIEKPGALAAETTGSDAPKEIAAETLAEQAPAAEATTRCGIEPLPGSSTAQSASSGLPRWPPSAGLSGGQGSASASSIKALNLEPMRANAGPRAAPKSLGSARLQAGECLQPLPPQQALVSQPQQVASLPEQLSQPPPQGPQQEQQPSWVPPEVQPVGPQPQALSSALAAAGSKKGLKLKNAAMARPGSERTPEAESRSQSHAEYPPEEDAIPVASPRSASETLEAPVEAAPGQALAIDDRPDSRRRVLNLNPEDKVFSKDLLLRIGRVSKCLDINNELKGLHVNVRPGDRQTPVDMTKKRGDGRRGGGGTPHNTEPTDRQFFGTNYRDSRERGRKDAGPGLASLKTTENAYRITEAVGREGELERKVRSLLNKICPDNLTVIVERLAMIELHKSDELEFVIRIIFGKALAEPHYCETYADMVYALRERYPTFPAEVEGEKPMTFTRVLLNTCQNEFESLPTTFEPTEEETAKLEANDLRLTMKKRKDKMLANMKFIGNLFLRQLLAVKVIGQVVHDLIGIKQSLPEEHMIECVCELLQAIGFTLDNSSQGKTLMSQFAARLIDLKRMDGPSGKGSIFSKRIAFQIQDLLDLRSNDWMKKLFKEQAKRKDEVRKDAINEVRQTAKGAGTEAMFQRQIVGMRPTYIDEFKNVKPRSKAPEIIKPTFDQAYVKRLFQYFAEDRNAQELEDTWNRATPSPKEVQQGATWLVEIGFNDKEKEDVVAETIVALVARNMVSWNVLKDALAPTLEYLEDFKMDVPTADLFFHSLLSRLLLSFGARFNSVILEPLPMTSSGEGFVWSLLVGAFKKLKAKGGAEAVGNALDIHSLVAVACRARRCGNSGSELRRSLQEEGIL